MVKNAFLFQSVVFTNQHFSFHVQLIGNNRVFSSALHAGWIACKKPGPWQRLEPGGAGRALLARIAEHQRHGFLHLRASVRSHLLESNVTGQSAAGWTARLFDGSIAVASTDLPISGLSRRH